MMDIKALTPEQHLRMRSAVKEMQEVIDLLSAAGYKVELQVIDQHRIGDRYPTPVVSMHRLQSSYKQRVNDEK